MKNLRSLLIVPAALLLVFLAVVPAAADHGSDSDQTSTTSSSGSGDSSASSSDVSANDSSGGDHSTAEAKSSTAEDNNSSSDSTDTSVPETEKQAAEDKFSKEAEDHINNLLQNQHAKKHSDSQRTKNCQKAQKGLQTKLQNLQKNAAAHKALIDKVYSEALAYQQQSSLNPAGFGDLVNAANAAQSKAALSVAALGGLSVNLDCSSGSVAQNVATFQAAAQQARNDLLAYRTAVHAVLQALENIKA